MKKIDKNSSALLRCRSLLVLMLQVALILCSLLASWLLRFEFQVPDPALLRTAALILIIVRLAVMPFFNLMHGWWRYTGISDAVDVLKATVTGSLAFLIIVRYGLGLKIFPLSVYVLEGLITLTLLIGIRVLARMLRESVRVDSTSKRLLLVGAGHAAQMIIRETQGVETGYTVVGCVDDDPLKKGLRVLGVPVLGKLESLAKEVRERRIDEVLIAIPSATQAQMRRLVEICKEAGSSFRTVPEMAELIAGQATLQQVREVSLADLLGRNPVTLDLEAVREHFRELGAVPADRELSTQVVGVSRPGRDRNLPLAASVGLRIKRGAESFLRG
jgi:FlaA1/EpsC-like NDP-sugar epimerase